MSTAKTCFYYGRGHPIWEYSRLEQLFFTQFRQFFHNSAIKNVNCQV